MFIPQSVWQRITHSSSEKEYLVNISSVTDEMNLQLDEKEQGENEDIKTSNITQNNETKPVTLHKKSDVQVQEGAK